MKIFPAVLRPPYTAAVPYSGILDFYRVTTHAGHGDRQQCLHAIRKSKKKSKSRFSSCPAINVRASCRQWRQLLYEPEPVAPCRRIGEAPITAASTVGGRQVHFNGKNWPGQPHKSYCNEDLPRIRSSDDYGPGSLFRISLSSCI